MKKDLVRQLLDIPQETQSVEFKRLGDASKNNVVSKTIESVVAMTNTEGGMIILGIEDPEKAEKKGVERIFGIEESLELYDELGREISKITPPLSNIWPPILIPVPGTQSRIAIIQIPKAIDGFRAINNAVYIRGEKGNKRLSPQEIIHLNYAKGFSRADKELVDADFKLLNTSYFQSWREKRGIADTQIETVLEKTGLARIDEKGTLRPTRAAVLLFAEYPNDLMDTKCTIKVIQYLGKTERIDDETINILGTPKLVNGPIIKQIYDCHEYVLNILKTGVKVPSGFQTTYKIPERAVKEAITNAVIHRDYYAKRDIVVRVYEDRVEIESPGLFPFNITPANIGVQRAYGYRNDLIVKHLREFPNPPNLDENEGVRAMRTVMMKENLYPPAFITYPHLQDSIRVLLFNQQAPSEWDKVSQYLNTNKYIKNAEARALLHLEDTVKVSRLFNRWVKQGLLMQLLPASGSKKEARYKLASAREDQLLKQ